MDKPAGGKVGGFLHKTPGLGKAVGGDALEASVAYRLVPAAGGSPALAATAVGKTGSTFNWKNAVTIAASLSPMLMMSRMMTHGAFNPSMMNALSSGQGYGSSMAGMDPMMNTLSLCLRSADVAAGAQSAQAAQPAADNAVAAALDQVAKAVISQIKK